jgi:hypothetical protein
MQETNFDILVTSNSWLFGKPGTSHSFSDADGLTSTSSVVSGALPVCAYGVLENGRNRKNMRSQKK